MFLAVVGSLAAAQVVEARVVIDVGSDRNSVVADYVLSGPAENVTFDAIRWPGQIVSLRDTHDLNARDLGGSLRLEPSLNGRERLRLEYDVSGNLARTPIFLPSLPTIPGTSRVSILVRNVGVDIPLADAFPRFVRAPEGSLVARPANLPSFVFVPIERRLSRARIADGMVLLMLLAATVTWVARQVRSA